jgi:hypothetical protein
LLILKSSLNIYNLNNNNSNNESWVLYDLVPEEVLASQGDSAALVEKYEI